MESNLLENVTFLTTKLLDTLSTAWHTNDCIIESYEALAWDVKHYKYSRIYI